MRPRSPLRHHRLPRAGLFVLLFGAWPLAAQEDAYVGAFPARPLFETDEILRLTLRTDFRALFRDRDTARSPSHEARLTFWDADSHPSTTDVKVRTRGAFRLRPAVCNFPPLRLDFPRQRVAGTVFAHQNELKLVTSCQSRRSEYEQYLLQEYLMYRLYNLFTPLSFRVRLARITYEDARGAMEPLTRFAILVESEEDMAARNGGVILDRHGARREHLERETMDRMAVFQFLIANVDWSVPGLHNIRLVLTEAGALHPVPYDFDWAGVIGTPYATPGPTLPIRSVSERLYRGHCVSLEEIRPAMDEFVERRGEVYALVDGTPELEPQVRRRLRRSFDEFYETIGDARRMERELRRSCLRS